MKSNTLQTCPNRLSPAQVHTSPKTQSPLCTQASTFGYCSSSPQPASPFPDPAADLVESATPARPRTYSNASDGSSTTLVDGDDTYEKSSWAPSQSAFEIRSSQSRAVQRPHIGRRRTQSLPSNLRLPKALIYRYVEDTVTTVTSSLTFWRNAISPEDDPILCLSFATLTSPHIFIPAPSTPLL